MRPTYTPNLNKMPLSAILYALSDPVRLKVVRLLLETPELCCGDFKAGVSKSTLSHHLKTLREAGILAKREAGTRQFNSLRTKELEARFPGILEALRSAEGPL